MKKLLILTLALFFPLAASAFQDCNLTLKKKEAYMLFIDERPAKMVVTEPNVMSVQLASDLFNVSHHIVIKTFSTGKSDLLITTAEGKKYTVNVNVEANPVVSNEVFEVDVPPGS
ncbi:TPA: hypothetical protein IAD52_09010 [Candidatus Spyradomonas excrementavium]|nr:hypothetical protein [Candidatus Spyradomonas excrementavium]